VDPPAARSLDAKPLDLALELPLEISPGEPEELKAQQQPGNQ
jgi:hypothetical protein